MFPKSITWIFTTFMIFLQWPDRFQSSCWHHRQNFLLMFYDACPHQNRFVAYNLKGPACFFRHLIPSSGVNRPGNRVNFSSAVPLSSLGWQTCLTTQVLSLSLSLSLSFFIPLRKFSYQVWQRAQIRLVISQLPAVCCGLDKTLTHWSPQQTTGNTSLFSVF